MKRVIRFHKGFPVAVSVSGLVILAGIVGLALMGFNIGIDFQAGTNIQVQFAPKAIELSYSGVEPTTFSVETLEGVQFATFRTQKQDGTTGEQRISLAEAKTMGALVESFAKVPGVAVKSDVPADIATSLFYSDQYMVDPSSKTGIMLSTAPIFLHYRGKIGVDVTETAIRSVLEPMGNVAIQRVGSDADMEYMIRVQSKESGTADSSKSVVAGQLDKQFGAGNWFVRKQTTVGARSSSTLLSSAIWLTLMTFLLILIYCTIRFKMDYAFGAIFSVVHDALVMITFIVFTRMEFNTTTIAAILTIVGYSINDTIVIFDRIREKVKQNPEAHFYENLDRGVTETLGRSIITSSTVILSVLALLFFTTGSMRDFAILMFVGVTTGTYSSTFIASAFVSSWRGISEKRRERAKLRTPAPAKR